MTRLSASPASMGSAPSDSMEHPLGPLVRMVRFEHPVIGRLYALAVVVGVVLVFAAAWRIHPGQARIGTHRQLGLPPCGFLAMTGLPCPTCGMTTAFAYTVRGEFASALRSQAVGFLLALATLAAGVIGLIALVRGRRPSANWYRINPVHVVWWAAVVFVLGWALKMGLGLADGSLPLRGAG